VRSRYKAQGPGFTFQTATLPLGYFASANSLAALQAQVNNFAIFQARMRRDLQHALSGRCDGYGVHGGPTELATVGPSPFLEAGTPIRELAQ
jgi:hypothetical protein